MTLALNPLAELEKQKFALLQQQQLFCFVFLVLRPQKH